MLPLVALLLGLAGVAAGCGGALLARRLPHARPAGQRWRPHGRADDAVVAGGVGLLWALLALRLGGEHPAALPAYLALAFACVVLAAVDARTRLLPNRLTYPAFATVAVLLLAASVAEHDLARAARAAEAGALAGAVFLALALASPNGIGLGDVKLAPTLGLALGWLSWAAVAVGFFSAFLLGGLAGVSAMVVLRLGRRARLPFGPWLAAGALLGVLAGAELARWYGHAVLGG